MSDLAGMTERFLSARIHERKGTTAACEVAGCESFPRNTPLLPRKRG
jgi:hypothetical protein